MVYPEVNLQSGVPIYRQLKNAYHRMAALGIIQPHEQLPSVRQLATELGINPNTVQKAYRELEQEGLIYAVPGRGNFLGSVREDLAVEREEILRNFRPAVHVAWTAGITREALHILLDECISDQLTD